MRVHIIFLISLGLAYAGVEDREDTDKIYKPQWADLNKRPLPKWFDQVKVGILIHWGIYSVPGFVSSRFWELWKGKELPRPKNSTYDSYSDDELFTQYDYDNDVEIMSLRKSDTQQVREFMKKHYPPDFTYQDFAEEFKAEFFNATEWANLFKASGAKYVIFTCKDKEGFELWPSNSSFSWNSVDTGPRRDLIGELAKALTNAKLKFGIQYALIEWFNPLYIRDRLNKYKTQTYPSAKVWPDLRSIVEQYKPSIIWSNGGGGAGDKYWNSTGLFTWLYNSSPIKKEVVVSNRWDGPKCKHGDTHYGCSKPGVLQKHKWENLFSIEKGRSSWVYRRNAQIEDFKSIQEILLHLVRTVSCGGNFLINVGPTKEGVISPIYGERLMQLGGWLKINGEAIYETSPWIRQNDSSNRDVWYTCQRKQPYKGSDPIAPPTKGSDVHAVYVITLQWPAKQELIVKDIAPFMKQSSIVTLFGFGKKTLEWQYIENEARVKIRFPDLRPSEKLAHKEAWALKIVFGNGTCN